MSDHDPMIHLTPEQREVRLRFCEGLRQAYRVLQDFCYHQHHRTDVDFEISVALINQELHDVIEDDVQMLANDVAEFFMSWGDVEGEVPEEGDAATAGYPAGTGRGPATSEAGASDVPNPAPATARERLQLLREKSLARAGRAEPGPPAPP